jgi:hypothetical protein
MIATLYGPLYPPFALAVALDEIFQELTPSNLANVVGTVAVSVTVTALSLAREAVQGGKIKVLEPARHVGVAVIVTLVSGLAVRLFKSPV